MASRSTNNKLIFQINAPSTHNRTFKMAVKPVPCRRVRWEERGVTFKKCQHFRAAFVPLPSNQKTLQAFPPQAASARQFKPLGVKSHPTVGISCFRVYRYIWGKCSRYSNSRDKNRIELTSNSFSFSFVFFSRTSLVFLFFFLDKCAKNKQR